MHTIERMRGSLRRYVIGAAPAPPLTKDQLFQEIAWGQQSNVQHGRALAALKDEFANATSNMNQQFAKLATLATFLGFVLAGLGIAGHGAYRIAIVPFGIAAIVILWAQSPRLKVFQFAAREDAGLRCGRVMDDQEEYWYIYQRMIRREHTLDVIEKLVLAGTLLAITAILIIAVLVIAP